MKLVLGCYCCLCTFAFLSLALIFGLGADVIANHAYVAKLPQGTCNFQNATFSPPVSISAIGLGYVNVYNVSFSGLIGNLTLNKTLTVKYGPPPSWYYKTLPNVQAWNYSVQNNILSCYYDKVFNQAYTENVSTTGWIIAIAITSLLIVLSLISFSLYLKCRQAPPQ